MSKPEIYTPASSMYRILEGDHTDDAYVALEDYEKLEAKVQELGSALATFATEEQGEWLSIEEVMDLLIEIYPVGQNENPVNSINELHQHMNNMKDYPDE